MLSGYVPSQDPMCSATWKLLTSSEFFAELDYWPLSPEAIG
jgi:hypothetical protein